MPYLQSFRIPILSLVSDLLHPVPATCPTRRPSGAGTRQLRAKPFATDGGWSEPASCESRLDGQFPKTSVFTLILQQIFADHSREVGLIAWFLEALMRSVALAPPSLCVLTTSVPQEPGLRPRRVLRTVPCLHLI